MAERVRSLGGTDGGVYVELLHNIAMRDDEPTKVRLDALRIRLTRGYGNPPEQVHLETSNEMLRAGAYARSSERRGC